MCIHTYIHTDTYTYTHTHTHTHTDTRARAHTHTHKHTHQRKVHSNHSIEPVKEKLLELDSRNRWNKRQKDAKKRFWKRKSLWQKWLSKNLIFIPNRKISTPDYSSASREGKSLDLQSHVHIYIRTHTCKASSWSRRVTNSGSCAYLHTHRERERESR